MIFDRRAIAYTDDHEIFITKSPFRAGCLAFSGEGGSSGSGSAQLRISVLSSPNRFIVISHTVADCQARTQIVLTTGVGGHAQI